MEKKASASGLPVPLAAHDLNAAINLRLALLGLPLASDADVLLSLP